MSGSPKDRTLSGTTEAPLVTVVLPVRNGLPYLPIALESLRAQTHADLEILVVDDGSRDGTVGYLRTVHDPRVRVLRSGGAGIVAALNLGLSHASGEFVARQDADDWSRPDRIARQVAFLRANVEIDLVATHAAFVDGDGRPVETPWTQDVRRWHEPATTPDRLRRLLPLTCCIIHGSVLARRDVLRSAGGYRSEFEWAEDYDLWLRLLPDHQFACLDERLYVHRIHAGQVSEGRRDEQLRRTLRAKLEYLRRTHPSLPRSARMAIVGNGHGATIYRELAPGQGFIDAALPDVDVVIATDMTELYDAALHGPTEWDGNFLVHG